MLFRTWFQVQDFPKVWIDKLETYPQVISNEIFDRIPNILWICFHVSELEDLQFFGSTFFFTLYGGFLLITLLTGMLHCSFLQGLKDHTLLNVCAKFLAFLQDLKDHTLLNVCAEFYLILLFNFKSALLRLFLCNVDHVCYYINHFHDQDNMLR